MAGQPGACLCPELMDAFFQDRKTELSQMNAIVDMSAETFLRLGALTDWMGPHGARMIHNAEALDTTMRIASTQADLYGVFFNRPRKRVQVRVMEDGRFETRDTAIDRDHALFTLERVRSIVHRYILQGNVKTREGRQHPDRDAQFRYKSVQ